MTKFKTTINDLQQICRMASLKGTNEQSEKEYDAMMDMLLVVGDTLEVASISALKELMVKINYKAEILEKGEIAIPSIDTFEKFLGRFNPSDTVTVSVDVNKVVIERETPKKIARMPIGAVESLTSSEGVKKFLDNFVKTDGVWVAKGIPYNLTVTFDVGALKEVIEDGDVVKQRVYPFIVDKDVGFKISIGNEENGTITTFITTKSITNKEDTPTRTAYASGIDNLFSAVAGEVQVHMVAGGYNPLILEQHTEKYDFIGLLAPRVED
jgi:hypothetical protein